MIKKNEDTKVKKKKNNENISKVVKLRENPLKNTKLVNGITLGLENSKFALIGVDFLTFRGKSFRINKAEWNGFTPEPPVIWTNIFEVSIQNGRGGSAAPLLL